MLNYLVQGCRIRGCQLLGFVPERFHLGSGPPRRQQNAYRRPGNQGKYTFYKMDRECYDVLDLVLRIRSRKKSTKSDRKLFFVQSLKLSTI